MSYQIKGVFEFHTIELDANGDGSKVVTFEAPFISTPYVAVVGTLADSGTYSASGASNTGVTINVSGSDIASQNIRVKLMATEYV